MSIPIGNYAKLLENRIAALEKIVEHAAGDTLEHLLSAAKEEAAKAAAAVDAEAKKLENA